MATAGRAHARVAEALGSAEPTGADGRDHVSSAGRPFVSDVPAVGRPLEERGGDLAQGGMAHRGHQLGEDIASVEAT